MADAEDTQDEPIEARHSYTDDDQVAGILVQQEADLAGHDEAEVLHALRERFAQSGHRQSEATLQEHARRIAGLKPNDFSRRR